MTKWQKKVERITAQKGVPVMFQTNSIHTPAKQYLTPKTIGYIGFMSCGVFLFRFLLFADQNYLFLFNDNRMVYYVLLITLVLSLFLAAFFTCLQLYKNTEMKGEGFLILILYDIQFFAAVTNPLSLVLSIFMYTLILIAVTPTKTNHMFVLCLLLFVLSSICPVSCVNYVQLALIACLSAHSYQRCNVRDVFLFIISCVSGILFYFLYLRRHLSWAVADYFIQQEMNEATIIKAGSDISVQVPEIVLNVTAVVFICGLFFLYRKECSMFRRSRDNKKAFRIYYKQMAITMPAIIITIVGEIFLHQQSFALLILWLSVVFMGQSGNNPYNKTIKNIFAIWDRYPIVFIVMLLIVGLLPNYSSVFYKNVTDFFVI